MSGCTGDATRRHNESGQVAPLMAAAIMVVAGIAVVLVVVGGVLADRAQARTAADAAALAAAMGTDTDATAIARDNGAELLAVYRHGDAVEVEVRVGQATARARATITRQGADARDARSTGDAIP